MQALIDVILPVFLVIGAGYVSAKLGYFTETLIAGLMKFAVGFAIPCLLFLAIANLDLQSGFDPGLLLSFYGGATICFLLGLFGARYLFGRTMEDSVAIGFACLFSNSVLLGLPITERAYGPDALTGNFAIVALHAPYCYGLGVTVMEIVRNRGKGGGVVIGAVLSSMFKNALLVAIGLGFIVNLLGIPLHGTLTDALDLIARAGLPCALVALGGVLSQYKSEGDLRVILWVVCITLVVHPVLVWTFGTAFDLNRDLFRSAVLTAAMAPGVNAYLFASMYGRAMRVSASVVLIATAASVGTIWVWLSLIP
ncbi:MAG: AEC family transporter [Paracoccaceae bacterium]